MPFRSDKGKKQWNQPHVGHVFGIWNLLGDPFALSTLSISLIAWALALAGSIRADPKEYPVFSWWGIAWQFVMIFIVLVFYLYDIVDYYKGFLVAGNGVAFVYTTNTLTTIIYQGEKLLVASAGFVILSIVNILWLFYFGSDNASPTSRWIDSFSVSGIRPSLVDSSLILARTRKSYVDRQPPNNGIYGNHEIQSQNYMSSTALNGFENAEPHAGPNMGANQGMIGIGEGMQNSDGMGGALGQSDHTMDTQATNTYITDTTNGNTETTMGDTLGLYSDVGDELISFPYTAKALYAYEADTSDAYEISFQQGEILRVGDIEGRWWKAKRSNGETGIIPSNYVELIDDPSML